MSDAYRARFVKFGADNGFPDLVVLLSEGRVHFLEVKRPKLGVVSPAQTKWHARARSLGHRVDVVTSPEEALAALRRGTA